MIDRIGSGHRYLQAGCLAWAVTASQAGAAASTDDQTGSLEPVVVTANRSGAESLQTVPMTISTLNPDDLNAKGLSAIGDFLRSVPGVVLTSEDAGVNRITMRGLVSRGIATTDLQDRSLVALYLDEIPIGLNLSNPDLRVVEMERIEVIRGPQGTLYGAGAMAGTIRYITKKPDATKFFGDAEVQLSGTDSGGLNWNGKLAANVPLVDDMLALRFGIYREKQDGYIDNVGLGRKNANSQGNTQANVAVRWLPTDQLTVDASVTYQRLISDGSNSVYSDLDGKTTSTTPLGFKDNLKIFNVTVNYDAGIFDVVSSTSYVDRKFEIISSFDFINQFILGQPFVSPSEQANKVSNFTQEVRLVSKPGRLHWQAGAYFGLDKRDYIQNTHAYGLDDFIGVSSTDLFAPLPDEIYYADIHVEDKQWALFGEATYDITDQFAVTAGLRYFNFKGPADYVQGGLAGVDAAGLPVDLTAEEKSTGVNPRLVVSYKPNDELMLFAEAARGFRYGGVNYPVPDSFCAASLAQGGLTSAPLTFGPDNVWSYSIGEKASLLDRRMTLNTTAFLINWNKAQTVHNLDCGYPFTENGGKVRSQGVEFESQIKVTHGLTLSLNATYTDSHSVGGIPDLDAHDGDKVPYFPEWSAAISGDYLWYVGPGKLLLGADWSYHGPMGTEFDTSSDIYRRIPSSAVVNSSVNYLFGPWEVGVFGTNLSNNRQITSIEPNNYAGVQPGDISFIGRPRTIGIRVKRSF